MGFFPLLVGGDSALLATTQGRKWYDEINSGKGAQAALDIITSFGKGQLPAGFPTPGKNKAKTIAEDLPGAMRPVLDLAGQHGVKLALENWYATNIQHLDHWRGVFDALPDAHFGLNFDPSHLDWQGIDVNAAVHEFRERIFHVHAKDVSVDLAKLKRVGYNGDGWWRYTLPGYGRILWGDFITTLRKIGYDDVLSIEHEDDAFPAEEGFVKAARYLNTLV